MDLFAGSQYEYDSENKTILLDIPGESTIC